VDAFNKENRWKKRGLSVTPVKFGMSFTAKFMNQASALVHVYTDGSVLVSHGGTEIGQGINTKMCQIAATELGVPLEKVHIVDASTDKCANTHPTAASVGADLNGMAVQDACQQINKRLEALRQANPGKSLGDLAMVAWLNRIDLSAHGYYKTPDIGYNFDTQEGKAFHYFAYGMSVSEVEVDVLTGEFTILRTDILHDVGDSLNPSLDVGQIEGAFIQGMGLFTLEEMVWMKNGQLFTRGPSTYKIPSANDVPIDFRVRLFNDAPNRRTIYSSKGVGEPPLNHGISVLMAIKDAVASARADNGQTGYFRMDTPASVERIRLACSDFILERYAPKPVLANGSW
jgi:xanthine dehydrogenase/oxidase